MELFLTTAQIVLFYMAVYFAVSDWRSKRYFHFAIHVLIALALMSRFSF